MFSFKRRINRLTYFAGVFSAFLFLLLIAILSTVFDEQNTELANAISVIIFIPTLIGFLFYIFCLTRQRSNDISGENAILFTILGIIALGPLLGVIPGEKNSNRYGPKPKKGVFKN